MLGARHRCQRCFARVRVIATANSRPLRFVCFDLFAPSYLLQLEAIDPWLLRVLVLDVAILIGFPALGNCVSFELLLSHVRVGLC